MSEVCQVQVQPLGKLQENSLRPSKDKNCKVHIKKPEALLNIYYFASVFLGNALGLMQFIDAVYKDWLDKYNASKY